jgi:iron complex outermembrane recepter protein
MRPRPDHGCPRVRTRRVLLGTGVAAWLLATPCVAAEPASPEDLSRYKKLRLEDLLDVEVTTASRRAEPIGRSASAVQVITREDIRRSGATNLPEALRLAPNLQVAQVNASQWAVSARGFNNVLANKLLVLIDGRSVYGPLFSGVFWDVQEVMLEDIERIEVVSGPGGTLWGANAVNGVINIITRSASDTQGAFVEAGAGSELRAFAAARFGGSLSDDLRYRVYGKAFERDDTLTRRGGSAHDSWSMAQGGFRTDWRLGGASALVIQGDWYHARPDPSGNTIDATGGNALTRFTHTFSETSELQLQLYFDRTRRDNNTGFVNDTNTYDLDLQHSLELGDRNQIVWGLGYRHIHDDVQNLPLFGIFPGHERLAFYSVFGQDTLELWRDRLELTLGAKLERNDYTGWEIQPSARLAWTPSAFQTVWAAVSRAQRTPSRLERGFTQFLTPGIVLLQGTERFETEDLLAYELGWRLQPAERLSLSLATFYNQYDHLRSADRGSGPFGTPFTIKNGARGISYGLELSALYEVASWWRLRAGYTALRKRLDVKNGHLDQNRADAEYHDPGHSAQLQSSLDLTERLELNALLRYASKLTDVRASATSVHVPSVLALDLGLVWRLGDQLELSVVGQNLLERRHREFVPASPAPRDVERGVYGKVTWRR